MRKILEEPWLRPNIAQEGEEKHWMMGSMDHTNKSVQIAQT